MGLALRQAKRAARLGESPVGAVVFSGAGELLAKAHNEPIGQRDPTAHAEILALRRAAKRVGNYRLGGAVLVATLEPCLMCLGALVQARIGGLVFGAFDPKAGAVSSRLAGPELDFLNHRFPFLGGFRAQECGALLSDFFRARRLERKAVALGLACAAEPCDSGVSESIDSGCETGLDLLSGID